MMMMRNNDVESQMKDNDRHNNSVTRYDPNMIRDGIVHGLDWNELCQHYDQEATRCPNNLRYHRYHHTPLGIIVGDLILLNPTLVPYACYPPVVQALLQIWMNVSTVNTRPSWMGRLQKKDKNNINNISSQTLLLETIATLVRRSRHVRLSSLVMNCLENDPTNMNNSVDDNDDDIDTYRCKYALLKRLDNVFPGQETTLQIPGLLCILQQMDHWDVRLLTTAAKSRDEDARQMDRTDRQTDDDDYDKTKTSRKRFRPKFATLNQLHDGESVPDDECLEMQGRRWLPHHARFHPPRTVTMKDVIKVNGVMVALQNHKKTAFAFTQLPLEAVVLRSKCYKSLLQMAESHLQRADVLSNVFDQTIRWTLLLHESSSAACRLSLVLLADAANGGGGYQLLVERLMHVAFAETIDLITAERVWRMYSELLVDGCHFDSRLECWNAMQPLVQALMVHSSPADEIVTNPPTVSKHTSILLRCLVYILSKRRRLLTLCQDDALGQQIQAFLTTLSLSFGHENYWIASSSNMGASERENVLYTLQVLGIIGICGVDEESDLHDNENDDGNDCDESQKGSSRNQDDGKELETTACWPFAKPNTLRCAYRRMGPRVCHRQLLSRIDHDFYISQTVDQQEEDTFPRSSSGSVPFLEYMNDDTLGLVFSYFTYKRLVWVRQVCKAWKEVADQDSLWRDAYVARFHPIMPSDDQLLSCSTPSLESSWKQLFMDKYDAERRIRFLRNRRTGWKVRTCGHVGCLEVLRTQEQLKRHYEAHRKSKSKRNRPSTPTRQGRAAKSKSNKKVKKENESSRTSEAPL